jgi:hypothetical protein
MLHLSLRSVNRSSNHGYVQLATVRPDGRPANRTIVYRGFLSDQNAGIRQVHSDTKPGPELPLHGYYVSVTHTKCTRVPRTGSRSSKDGDYSMVTPAPAPTALAIPTLRR